MQASRLCLALCAFLFGMSATAAQESPGEEFFRIADAKLEFEEHVWGNELYVKFELLASSLVGGCELEIALWYCGNRVRWDHYSVPEISGKLSKVRHRWGPLNQSYEYVLSGKYKFEVKIVPENQQAAFQDRLRKALKGKVFASCEIALEFRTKEMFDQEEGKIVAFYRTRMVEGHNLYRELKRETQRAQSTFDPSNWRAWRRTFNQRLDKEAEAFAKYNKVIFSSRHPVARASLENYYQLLARLGKQLTIQLYASKNLRPEDAEMQMDSFGIERPEGVERNLHRLLRDVAGDVGVDIQEITRKN